MTPEREAVADTPCCCVLIDEEEGENPCNAFTSGPDDPFCNSCTPRHPEIEANDSETTVTQRLPERAS